MMVEGLQRNTLKRDGMPKEREMGGVRGKEKMDDD
jgi:hypothetical protein